MSMPPVDAAGTQYEEMPARSGVSGYVYALVYVALGIVTIWLAADEEFARDKAAFANDAWRAVFGALGALVTFLGARAVVRAMRDERPRLTPELHRRGARRGKILVAVGLAFIVMALVAPVAEETIELSGWATGVYVTAGVLFVVQGLVLQWDPTRFLRQQRIRKGEGRPGTARIVRAADTGTSVNDAPQVKIDFELDVGGRTFEVSDKIVMERAKLALLIPGSTVNVLVDRVDPNVFHVDWDSWKAP